ncbi:MAG TPA: flavodoxin domain-containing protein [Ktedonobacterales bacterium]|nr:flavodoxin domain-containing protein [Ktedonobacterales bacterium]
MNSVVIYASHFGNTRKVAEVIAGALQPHGPVHVFSVDEAPTTFPAGTDLVLVGGPTEQHKMTEPMASFFDHLAPGALEGIAAAAFDTRLRWPRWLSGSAGSGIEQNLRHAGARVIAPAESFFIKGAAGTGGSSTAELDSGELERAARWAASVAGSPTLSTPAAPGR